MKSWFYLGLIALAGTMVGVMAATVVAAHTAAVGPANGGGGTSNLVS